MRFAAAAAVMVAVALPVTIVASAAAPAAPVDAGGQDHHAGVMKRGAEVMGFDQATTTHHFRLLPGGGAIEVTANDARDAAAIAQIRTHLQHIATMFGSGTFSAPMLIHAQEPPGVPELKRAGAAVTYRYEPLDRGGKVVIDTKAHTKAVHEFLRFQIVDHKTGDPLEVAPAPVK